VFEDMKGVLYSDSAVAGAALALTLPPTQTQPNPTLMLRGARLTPSQS